MKLNAEWSYVDVDEIAVGCQSIWACKCCVWACWCNWPLGAESIMPYDYQIVG